jgi:hypothetical protein
LISKEELFKLSQDNNPLADINDMHIDTTLPIVQRFESFLCAVKNPYCFLCDGIPVRLRFSDDGKPLEEIICNHFARNISGQ